jgi:anti-repressor protein
MRNNLLSEQLIGIEKRIIGGYEVDSVDARKLYKDLGSKQQFANWIKAKVRRYEFAKNKDYAEFVLYSKNKNGGRPKTEFCLTIDAAKIISVAEKTKRGILVYKKLCEHTGYAVVTRERSRKEIKFGKEIIFNLFSDYTIIPQYPVLDRKYRIDWYIPELNLAMGALPVC